MKAWILGLFVLATAAVWAAPQGAGIPFDGKTGFRVDRQALGLKSDGFSVAAWVKAAETNRSQAFLGMGAAAADFTLYLYNGAVRMLVEGAPGKYGYALADGPQADVWTHYLGTYDGKTVKVYRNGVLKGRKDVAYARDGFADALLIGKVDGPDERALKGALEDIRIWNRVLGEADAKAVCEGRSDGSLAAGLIARWTGDKVSDKGLENGLAKGPVAETSLPGSTALINGKVDGFRGIWYFNQPSKDEYVYKYSGGLGTYCANHIPMAWYAPAVNKTFFCYGGTDATNNTLLHMVSYYDHATGQVAKPTLLLDKKTDDAHDNPVINLDDKGYIWIFSSSHGRGRPSFISRSVKPYDIDQFRLMWSGNFSYPQPMYYPGKGFLFIHTWYVAGRGNYMMRSDPDGTVWTDRKPLSYFEEGHYQISGAWQQRKTGVAFNMHPKGKGLNWRTNIYYMESDDFGTTWKTVDGKALALPLSDKVNPAQVLEYESKHRNVYLSDVQFDSKGNPVILFVLSKGYESGPANGPREWRTVRWTGTAWEERFTGIASGSNYDVGPLYLESDATWRIIGPTQLGPQPYNPGGEIAMWLSEDAGATWKMTRQLTKGSEMNHTYVRRPVNARPDFYGLWADGHGRKPSESHLYFCNRQGDVFRLPVKMTEPFAAPEPVFR